MPHQLLADHLGEAAGEGTAGETTAGAANEDEERAETYEPVERDEAAEEGRESESPRFAARWRRRTPAACRRVRTW